MNKELEMYNDGELSGDDSGRELRLDEIGNASDALRRSVHFLLEVQQNSWAWKWSIIAMHDALYRFAVCAVAGTDYSQVTGKKKAKADSGLWEALLEIGLKKANPIIKKIGSGKKKNDPGKAQKERLLDFLSILEMCQQERYMAHSYGSAPLHLSAEEQKSLARMHELREKFGHFLPVSWHIEAEELVQICTVCFQSIRFLAVESGNVLHAEEQQQQCLQIEALCSTGTRLAETLKKQHAHS